MPVGLILSILISTTLSGCSIFFPEEKAEVEKAKVLFEGGRSAMSRERYQEALEKFEELEANYPFSIYAKQVALALSYLHYENHQYDKAIPILEQFIRLNPKHDNLDYAYYLKGLSHYYYGQKFISLLFNRDRTKKDATPLINSFDAFKHLHEKFPDSKYAEDAKLRTIVLRNLLALSEIRIANYYFQRGAYVAVINRIKYMLEHYEGAQHVPDGLILLAQSYERLKLNQLANDTWRVLELNYPNHRSKNIGEISEESKKKWFDNLRDWAGEIVELLKLKPRY